MGRPQPAHPAERPGARRPAARGRPGSDGGELRLSGFDYETSARATLPAEVADEGRALVSGRLLADICRSLPAHQVEITLDGQRVSLTCGSARFTLQTMPVEDYPALPGMPETAGTVPAEAFAHAVAQAVAAAGRDDMLPLLTGVRVEIDGASDLADGHRPLPAQPARARLVARPLRHRHATR